jgi:hypothetical protein
MATCASPILTAIFPASFASKATFPSAARAAAPVHQSESAKANVKQGNNLLRVMV